MKLYKLSQEINNGYDTYDSIIVCAENKEEARKFFFDDDAWVSFDQIDKIEVEYIGEASKDIKKGVILASFNAG